MTSIKKVMSIEDLSVKIEDDSSEDRPIVIGVFVEYVWIYNEKSNSLVRPSGVYYGVHKIMEKALSYEFSHQSLTKDAFLFFHYIDGCFDSMRNGYHLKFNLVLNRSKIEKQSVFELCNKLLQKYITLNIIRPNFIITDEFKELKSIMTFPPIISEDDPKEIEIAEDPKSAKKIKLDS